MTLKAGKLRAKELDEISEIVPGLLAGGYLAARDIAVLRGSGVTHLLSLREERAEGIEDLEYLNLPMSDSGDSVLCEVASNAARFIDAARDAGGRVLVYCDMGVNRTAAVIAGYLILKGWSLEAATERISRVRSVINIIEPYNLQLRALAEEPPVECRKSGS